MAFELRPNPPPRCMHTEIQHSIGEIGPPSCRDIDVSYEYKRHAHTLQLINHGRRQRFTIDYLVDTDACKLCQDMDHTRCDGGVLVDRLTFPMRDAYWRGARKTFVKAFSWRLNIGNPDFNLEIRIAAFESGVSITEDDSVSLVVYCSS